MNRQTIRTLKTTGPIAVELVFDAEKKKTFSEATGSVEKMVQSVISATVGGKIDKEKIKEATQHAVRFWKKPVEANPLVNTRVWQKPKDLEQIDLQLYTEKKGALRWTMRTFKDVVLEVLKDQALDVTNEIHDQIWSALRSKVAQFIRDDILEVKIHYLPMTQECIYPPANLGLDLVVEGAKIFFGDDEKKLNIARSYLFNTGYGYSHKFKDEIRGQFFAEVTKKTESRQWSSEHDDPRAICNWMIAELHGLLGHSFAPAPITV